MPVVSYCKKCKQEVAMGDTCELCGGKLPKTARRVSWSCLHRPATDWLAWNSPMRIAIPVILVVALAVLLNEAIQGGTIGLQIILKTWFFPMLGGMFLGILGILLVWFLWRGRELNFFVLDHKAIHLQLYKHKKTDEIHLISERHILWSQIRRIEVLPERNAILIYAPKNWLVMVLYCDSLSYTDATQYIAGRVLKAKDVKLSVPIQGLDDIT